jgi:hypothetical protein
MRVAKVFASIIACLITISLHARADKKITSKPELCLIDKIEAVIFGDENTAIVTKSDVEKLTLEGRPRSLPDIIFEKLVAMDAAKFKIMADEGAVDRYLTMIMREHNLSQADLIAMFRSAGYTYEEGREQLATMFAVNTMIDFKIKSRLIIPEAQIISYYKEHPIIEEAAYRIQRIVVQPKKTMSAAEMKDKVQRALQTGKEVPGIQVSTAFWIKHDDIAGDKMFITTMKSGALSDPIKIKDGFEMFRLLEKREQREVPLEDRYNEISNELKKPLFEKLFQEYRKSLFDAASIVYY